MNRKVLTILAAGAAALAASGCQKEPEPANPKAYEAKPIAKAPAKASPQPKGLTDPVMSTDLVYKSDTLMIFIVTDRKRCQYVLSVGGRDDTAEIAMTMTPRMEQTAGGNTKQVCAAPVQGTVA